MDCMSASLQNSYLEVSVPPCDGIWRWEPLGGNQVESAWQAWCPYKKRKSPELTLSVPCEDTARRQPAANQKEGPPQTLNLLVLWS